MYVIFSLSIALCRIFLLLMNQLSHLSQTLRKISPEFSAFTFKFFYVQIKNANKSR